GNPVNSSPTPLSGNCFLEAARQSRQTWIAARLAMTQALLNGLVSGLLIALPAIALSLTYGILNFANFSIGAMITTGAYLAYIANTSFGAPILLAAPLGAIFLALIAVVIQRGVYRQIRNADHVTLLVASMGVAFVLENVIRFFL